MGDKSTREHPQYSDGHQPQPALPVGVTGSLPTSGVLNEVSPTICDGESATAVRQAHSSCMRRLRYSTAKVKPSDHIIRRVAIHRIVNALVGAGHANPVDQCKGSAVALTLSYVHGSKVDGSPIRSMPYKQRSSATAIMYECAPTRTKPCDKIS